LPDAPDENNRKPEDASKGIIFNFSTGEVAGFDSPDLGWYYHAKISAINDVTIYFRGENTEYDFFLEGSIDRVTGDLDATIFQHDKNKSPTNTLHYALHCKPTQRLF
jgi:hypothetical protein